MATHAVQDQEPQGEPDMRARIERFDWASTPLGPRESWPAALKLALGICEHSAFPTAIYWRPELILLYNEAWAPIPGERHPEALGRPAREVWADIWPVIGPQLEGVLRTGDGFSAFEQMLPMVRDGVRQETYWNYSFTPIRDDAGRVAGIFNQGNEITRAVVNERRLALQVMLADRLRLLIDPEQVKATASATLGQYLGAARVGYAEVEESQGLLTVITDWTRGPEIESLKGRTTELSQLSPLAIAALRGGQTLALSDVHDFSSGSSEVDSQLGTKLSVRAVMAVPLVRDGQLRALMFVHEPEPREWKRSEAAMARDVAERSWAAVERAKAELALRASEDHYRTAVELNPQVSWTSLPDGQLNHVSRRWFDWTGTTGLGDSWAGGLHPDDRQPTFDVWGRSVATGEPYDIEHRVKMRNGSYRWARSRAFPRRDEKGAIILWYGATEDIHERKLAEERQRLLINELNHRVKNSLATVQAIAFQTLKGGIPLEEARARFEARLLALSRAHNMLTERNWEGATLARVVGEATAHLAGPNRIQVEGPRIWLARKAALALALALHELLTNAGKYGALSTEAGTVSIRWDVEGDRLGLVWKERGGPEVSLPERQGFGSRLIERGLTTDLGGTARLIFERDGLRCVIDASLSAAQQPEPSDG
jgi:PAS domain S-box-containing protein